MLLVVKKSPANAGDIRDVGSIPGSRRSPGGGHSNALQNSSLENPMERGAWWAAVHGVSKTRLKRLSTHALLIGLSVLSDSLWPQHGLRHTRLACPSLSPGACSNSCPLSQRCYPTISSSVTHFSSRLQSFPASGSFPMSWLLPSGGQSTGASASVLLMNVHSWFPLGVTGLVPCCSRVSQASSPVP